MRVSRKAEAELAALADLPDSEIDTTDIPERGDWTGATRGRFSDLRHTAIHEAAHAVAKWRLTVQSTGDETDAGFHHLTLRPLAAVAEEPYVDAEGKHHNCHGITEMRRFDPGSGPVPNDVSPDYKFATDARRERIRLDIQVVLAGGIAEAKYRDLPFDDLIRDGGTASGDWQEAIRLADWLNQTGCSHEELLAPLRRKASDLVCRPEVWSAIVALAQAVLARADFKIIGCDALPIMAAAYKATATTIRK
jgi:hypothetical protein